MKPCQFLPSSLLSRWTVMTMRRWRGFARRVPRYFGSVAPPFPYSASPVVNDHQCQSSRENSLHQTLPPRNQSPKCHLNHAPKSICWNCEFAAPSVAQSDTPNPSSLFCDQCLKIQSIPPGTSYFDLFSIPSDRKSTRHIKGSFNLDLAQLRQVFLSLQAQTHPDRYQNASEVEQKYSHQLSMFINKAYQTLKDPFTRAKYILELNDTGNTPSSLHNDSSELIQTIMSVHEGVSSGEITREAALAQAQSQIKSGMDDIRIAFDQGDLERVRRDILVLGYWRSLARGLDDDF